MSINVDNEVLHKIDKRERDFPSKMGAFTEKFVRCIIPAASYRLLERALLLCQLLALNSH